MAALAELFFAFGGHNYARYCTDPGMIEVFLKNINKTHPGAKSLLE